MLTTDALTRPETRETVDNGLGIIVAEFYSGYVAGGGDPEVLSVDVLNQVAQQASYDAAEVNQEHANGNDSAREKHETIVREAVEFHNDEWSVIADEDEGYTPVDSGLILADEAAFETCVDTIEAVAAWAHTFDGGLDG